MRALRILVIVLGVLLVGGTVALVVAIVSRSGGRTVTATGGRPPAASTVTLPAGAAVLSVQTVGPHVVVQVGPPGGAGGSQQLLVIDPASGALRARIELRAE